MIFNRLAVLAFIALFVTGCASTPIPSKEAASVPAERVLAFQTKTPSANASLVVTRDDGLIGSGCFMALWVNSTLVGRFDTAETATFYVEPGDVLMRVGSDPQGRGLCDTMKDYWTQRETTLKPNERKTFRLTTDVNGKRDVERGE